MGQLNVRQRRQRGFALLKCIGNTSSEQPVLDGVQALGAFRMTWPHFVFFTIPVGEISSGVHGLNILG